MSHNLFANGFFSRPFLSLKKHKKGREKSHYQKIVLGFSRVLKFFLAHKKEKPKSFFSNPVLLPGH
jgi:hypothetical protein